MLSDAVTFELHDLIDGLCDGALTPEQHARLEAIVLESNEACQIYRDALQLHGSLYLMLGEDLAHAPAPLGQGQQAEPAPQIAAASLPARKWFRPAILLTAATAAALLLAVGWFVFRGAPAAPKIASLTRSFDASWSDQTRALLESASADKGSLVTRSARLGQGQQLQLVSGKAEILFDSGARVVLQGPATFTVETATTGRLLEGRLAARVPPQAKGFTIHTPDAHVVDQGTEFGVWVRGKSEFDAPTSDLRPPTSTEVHVFAGQVDVQPVQAAATRPRELRGGEAVRIASKAATLEPLPARDADFAAARSLLKSAFLLDDTFDDGDIARNDPFTGFVHPPQFWDAIDGHAKPCRGAVTEAGGKVTVSTSGKVWREYASLQSIDSFPAAGTTFAVVMDGAHLMTNDVELRLVSGAAPAGNYRFLSLNVAKSGMAEMRIQRGAKWPDNQVATCFGARATGWKPGDGPLEIRLRVDQEGYEVRFTSKTSVIESGKWPPSSKKQPAGLAAFTAANGQIWLQVGCHTRRSLGVSSVSLDRITVESAEATK